MEELLEILNLSQYTVSFKRYGITTCFDVTMLEDEDFEEVQVKPFHKVKMRRVLEEAMMLVDPEYAATVIREKPKVVAPAAVAVAVAPVGAAPPQKSIVFSDDEQEENAEEATEAVKNETEAEKAQREAELERKRLARTAKNKEKMERKAARLAEEERRRREVEAMRKLEEEQKQLQRERALERQKEKEKELETMAAEMSRKKAEQTAESKAKKKKKPKPPSNICLMWKQTGQCTFMSGTNRSVKGCSFNHDPEWRGSIDPEVVDASKLARLTPKGPYAK